MLPLGDAANRPWLVLTDVSDSVGEQSGAAITPPADITVTNQRFADTLLATGQPPARQVTRISPALQLAGGRARRRTVAGIVLRTDGQFHDAWLPAARQLATQLAEARVPLYIVPQDAPPLDARIVAFKVTPTPPAGCRLQLTVAANAILRRTITITRDDPASPATIYKKTHKLMPHRPITIRLTDRTTRRRPPLYTAAITPADKLPGNDRLTAIAPPSQPAVAYIDNSPNARPARLAELLQMPVEHLRAAGGTSPQSLAAWNRYAAVVLVDPAGNLLNPAQRAGLAKYVRSGGGLVLIGGGPRQKPADRRDPLNRVAALIPNPFQRNPLALTVILDASGSMAEVQTGIRPPRRKFSLAAEAIASLKHHLTPQDSLKVIVFSDKSRCVYDSVTTPPDFAKLRDALAAVQPTGPTHIAAALQMATKTPPPGKRDGLVLILSDLRTQKFDPIAVAERFKASRWRLGVVAIGSPGVDKLTSMPLKILARRCDAPLVLREHLRGLAEIFASLCRNARGDGLRSGGFKITATADWPELAGLSFKPVTYIQTAPARRAKVLARAGADPLLGFKQAGLGKNFTLAIAEDTKNAKITKISNTLLPAIARMTRRVARPTGEAGFAATVTRDGGELHLRLDARRSGKAINSLSLEARIQPLRSGDDSAGPIVARLKQIAPGLYEAAISCPPGPLGLEVCRTGGSTHPAPSKAGGVVWQSVITEIHPRELRRLGADFQALRKLADITGGRIITADELPTLMRQETTKSYRPIWQITLAAAVAIMLLNWAMGILSKNKYR